MVGMRGDIPSCPILASSDLTPANTSISHLRAYLTIAVWVAGAARGSGRASTHLVGFLRSFTSHKVCARDPASLSPIFLRVRTNPCDPTLNSTPYTLHPTVCSAMQAREHAGMLGRQDSRTLGRWDHRTRGRCDATTLGR